MNSHQTFPYNLPSLSLLDLPNYHLYVLPQKTSREIKNYYFFIWFNLMYECTIHIYALWLPGNLVRGTIMQRYDVSFFAFGMPPRTHLYSHSYTCMNLSQFFHHLIFRIVSILPSLHFTYTFLSILGEEVFKILNFGRKNLKDT